MATVPAAMPAEMPGAVAPGVVQFDQQGNQVSPDQHVTISMQEYSRLIQGINGQQPRGPPPPSGLGNPGPLGLGGFALTTFILSVFNAHVFIDPALQAVVLPLALFYGGIAQFIAGLYEFRIANTFGATAFCSYGAFWASFAAYVQFVVPKLPANRVDDVTGLFLLCWTIFTLYMMFGAFRVSWALFSVFVNLEITFIFLTAGAFASNKHTTEVGGWFGIVTAFCAWYCSAGVIINSTWGRKIVPIGVYTPPTDPNEPANFKHPHRS